MLTVIKHAELFAPNYLGEQDVILAGGRIAAIGDELALIGTGVDVQHVDAGDFLLVPGFVDALCHFSGGGGEGGFASRTPPLEVSEAAAAGVTTLVGALGTDSVTRSLADLLAKARELRLAGLSAYCYTGSYHLPVKTLTGSVERDLVYIPEVIGVGEVAIADHRSALPSWEMLARLVSEVRVAAMLAGKKGTCLFHVGDGDEPLLLLEQILENSDLPISHLYPTHCNRNESLFQAAMAFAARGGVIDLTASSSEVKWEVCCGDALSRLLEAGVSSDNISFSSDSNASLPQFDDNGVLTGLKMGRIGSLYLAVVEAVTEYQVPLALALKAITCNPAKALGLATKGEIRVGLDADLVLLDPDSYQIASVYAGGRLICDQGQPLLFGQFERG